MVCYPRECTEQRQEKGEQYQHHLQSRAIVEYTNTSNVELQCVCGGGGGGGDEG